MARPRGNPRGKLKRLAREWAGGASRAVIEDTPDFIAECAMLGINPAQLGGKRTTAAAEPVIIWPDMADSFALFMSSATQWRYVSAGLSGAFPVGLIYEALEPLARMIGVEMTPGVFSDIRTLESAALKVMNKRR